MLNFKAYAKINWHLLVFPVDETGFHKIETIFQSIDLADDLTFLKDNDLTLECSLPHIPKGRDNLIIKAALNLKEISGYKEGAKIILKKNIPLEAGLGGGSADAAVTLKALNNLWGLNLDKDRLYNLSKSLGADVAFNLKRGMAVGRGYGEVLEYFNFIPPVYLLVIKPEIGISTAWAYKEFDLKIGTATIFGGPGSLAMGGDIQEILNAFRENDWRVLKKLLKNDLEELVLLKHPEIKEIKESLIASGAEVSLMCGSGSAVFGVFSSEGKAHDAMKAFKEKFKEAFIARPVGEENETPA